MWRLLKCACWMLWVMWSVLKSAQCGMMPVMLLPTSSRWDLLHQCIISQHYGCIVYGKEQCEDCGFFKLAGLKSSKCSSSQFVVFVRVCLFHDSCRLWLKLLLWDWACTSWWKEWSQGQKLLSTCFFRMAGRFQSVNWSISDSSTNKMRLLCTLKILTWNSPSLQLQVF